MKRIGEKQTIKVLNEGRAIYCIGSTKTSTKTKYRLVNVYGAVVGYITYDLFIKLISLKLMACYPSCAIYENYTEGDDDV